MNENEKEYRLQLIGTVGLDIWLNANSEAHAEKLKEQVLKTINDQITIDFGNVDGTLDVYVDCIELEIDKLVIQD
ncbi:hypothetical protein PK1910_01000 [Veillonella parvula]|uniref:hypothetical protein n=1 Tax=Veillonella parvula TaxID=29466 RepID=UPI002F356759